VTGAVAAAAGAAASIPALTVQAIPDTSVGTWDAESGFGFTNPVTLTPSGGVAPYTYSWAFVSGDASPTISDTSSQTVNWVMSGAGHRASVWRGTVTDHLGQTASADVSVTAN
jgi:hypothetical protein